MDDYNNYLANLINDLESNINESLKNLINNFNNKTITCSSQYYFN